MINDERDLFHGDAIAQMRANAFEQGRQVAQGLDFPEPALTALQLKAIRTMLDQWIVEFKKGFESELRLRQCAHDGPLR